MKHLLSNGLLSFSSHTLGAEPLSLSLNGENFNYLWHNDKEGNPLTSICFPLIGAVPEDEYEFEGKSYTMPMHGFAQFRDFSCVELTENSLVYELVDDVDTLRCFPWKFGLQVHYSLEGPSLLIKYRIQNRDRKALYCSVGGHIRFSCPMGHDGSSFQDHSLCFEDPLTTSDIVKSYGPVQTIEDSLADEGRTLRLHYDLFDKGCFCLKPLRSGLCTLKKDTGGRSLSLRAENASYFQVWTVPGAPYIALEPLYGSISSLPLQENDRNWSARSGSLCIEPGKEIFCTYIVTINKNMEANK